MINVMYNITIPKMSNDGNSLTDNEDIKTVLSLFKIYKIEYITCDTIAGSFNLNQEWVETKTDIEAETSWCSVLPINWNDEDIFIFYSLIRSGKIIVRVHYVINENGETKYIPHH